MIIPLDDSQITKFFSYLDEQLSENGKEGGVLFQPVSRSNKGFPVEKQNGFTEGLKMEVGQPGWRRVWVKCDEDGNIQGHIDLRSRREPNTTHRALLGMGVHHIYRQMGIGSELVKFVFDWAAGSMLIKNIDLEVLAANIPAVHLYKKLGFQQLCEIKDMFVIDGKPEPYIWMTKRVESSHCSDNKH